MKKLLENNVGIVNIIGMLLFFTSMTFAWIWFSWKLTLIIFLAVAGNNFERHGKFKTSK